MRSTPGQTRAGERQRCRPARGCGSTRPLALAALALALAACGGGSGKATTAASAAPFKTLLQAGIHLLNLGNPEAAKQLFEQAIAKNPGNPAAHYDLGVVYQGAGDRRDALRQYSQALAADARYVPALYNRAILFSHDSPSLAMFYYRQVIHEQPNSPTAYLNLGLLENQTRLLRRRARADLMQAIRLDPRLRGRIPPPTRAQLGSGSAVQAKPSHR